MIKKTFNAIPLVNDTNFFSFNKIYYLNADVDNSTHRDLYQSVYNYSVFHSNSNISTEYEFINSKANFKDALIKIKEDTSDTCFPLIHIASHGGERGLLLPSGGRIHWTDLSYFLTEINIKCKNNLFVVFACCEGAYIALPMIGQMLLKGNKQRAPLFGYIAPTTEIKLSEIELGYKTFYDRLFQSFSSNNLTLDDAIEGLISNTKATIQCNSCIQLFRDSVDSLLKKDFEKYRNNLTLDTQIYNMLNTRYLKTGVMPDLEDYRKLRSVLLNERFYIDFFNNFRIKYFMIDLYPENEKRFIKLEKISNWSKITENIK